MHFTVKLVYGKRYFHARFIVCYLTIQHSWLSQLRFRIACLLSFEVSLIRSHLQYYLLLFALCVVLFSLYLSENLQLQLADRVKNVASLPKQEKIMALVLSMWFGISNFIQLLMYSDVDF